VGGGYGLCLFDPDCVPGDPFNYMAAVGVSRVERVPEGMTAESFPGGLYCVVTRQGVIDEIGAAFDYYWKEWLPQSGYASRGGVEFEYYDDRYHGNHNPESVMELWFPIRPDRDIPLENRVGGAFVHVTDLRRAAEWYSRLFGLSVREERFGGPVYWFNLPGTNLILDCDAANRENAVRPRFMFDARDIDEAYRYLREKVEWLSEPERYGQLAFFNFRDPEGNTLMACWADEPEADAELQGHGPILTKIGGVFVDVKDMRSAAHWYTELLGLPLDEKNAGGAIYSVPVTFGAALLLDQNRYLKGENFTELFYLETEDIESALEYVREHGYQLADEPKHFHDLSEFALLDPDGNRIVVAQMKPKRP
jgi:predicted enzyme related to lactoylglutathione lyase